MRPQLKLLDGATGVNGVPSNTAATGSIPATLGSAIVNLTSFVLHDGINAPIQFVFATAALTDAAATKVRIPYTAADSAATVQAAIIAAINGVTTALRITATDGGSNIVTLTNDFGGAHGNIAVGANTTGILITGMTGGITVGFPLAGMVPGTPYHWNLQDKGMLVLDSVAGTGALTASVRLWVYSEASHKWGPLGVSATIASRGLLNDGVLITADPANTLAHRELVKGLSGADNIYAQVVSALGGSSSPAIDLWLVSCARQEAA